MTNRLVVLPGRRGRVAIVHSEAGSRTAARLLVHLAPLGHRGIEIGRVVLPDDPADRTFKVTTPDGGIWFDNPAAPAVVASAQVLVVMVDVETVNALDAGLLGVVRETAGAAGGVLVLPVPTGVCRWGPLPELAAKYPIPIPQTSRAGGERYRSGTRWLRTEPLERLSPPRRDEVYCTLVDLIADRLGLSPLPAR